MRESHCESSNTILHQESPMSGASQWKRAPVVWIVAVQAAVLVFLVVFYLSWKGSMSELLWQLKHGSVGSRRDAVYELTRMGRGAIAAAPVLKEALEDSDPRIQTMAADALLRMGAWRELSSSDWMLKADPGSITSAFTEIANTYPPPMEALPIVESVLRKHPNSNERQEAVFTLGHYGAEGIPGLLEAYGDSEPTVRNLAQTVVRRIRSSVPQR